jgi:hypothetical protein
MNHAIQSIEAIIIAQEMMSLDISLIPHYWVSLIALAARLQEKYPELEKTAQVANSSQVGAYLANVCRFALSRVPENMRHKAVASLIAKLRTMDENAIAHKKMPPFASIAQCTNLIRNSLYSQRPDYIRAVLNAIAAHLR